jgi:hypothetical protein
VAGGLERHQRHPGASTWLEVRAAGAGTDVMIF